MDRLISCEFNMDTACVEPKFLDGSMIAIDTIAVNHYLLPWEKSCGSFPIFSLIFFNGLLKIGQWIYDVLDRNGLWR